MMDLLAQLMHFCASCVADSNAVPAAAGALGGAAAAAGGLGGLSNPGGGPGTGVEESNGGPSARAPVNHLGPEPIGDSPPTADSAGPKPIGDQGTLPPSGPNTLGMGTNPDGTYTVDDGYTGQRYTTLPDGSGPKPVGAETPPPGSATPIGDGPPTADSTPDTTAAAPPGDTPAGADATAGTTTTTSGTSGTNASSPFANESGGISEHADAPEAKNPSDPFASPEATPDPLFSDGPQVDGSTSPGGDTAETDYINPNGTPLGSSPTPTQGSGMNPQTSTPTHGVPHKPNKP
jgi:hypothetical protein